MSCRKTIKQQKKLANNFYVWRVGWKFSGHLCRGGCWMSVLNHNQYWYHVQSIANFCHSNYKDILFFFLLFGWYRYMLSVDAVEKLGLGYIKTWCISYVTFLCHSLVFIDLQNVWSSQCFRACGTMWGKCLSPHVWSDWISFIVFSLILLYSNWIKFFSEMNHFIFPVKSNLSTFDI